MQGNIPILDICSLSDFRENDIIISRFSDYLKKHSNLHFPHRHNFYHLVLFTKGEGSHTIDFNSFEVKANQIYFMIPGQVHTWNFEGEMDGYIVNFPSGFFQSFLFQPEYLESFSFFNGNAKDGVIDLSEELIKPIVELFEKMIYQMDLNKPFRLDLIRVLLLQLFILIDQKNDRITEDYTPNYNYTLLKNFQKLIDKNYTTLKLPMEYAALLYITPNHLNALCKDHLGIPAGEVIRNRIVLEAKRLLINLDLSISEIANALHFNDNSYFTKFFKKQTGVTPEEFRKNKSNTHSH